MIEPPLWLLGLAPLLLAGLAAYLGQLRWPRDYFFGVLYLQAVVYLYLAPGIVASRSHAAVGSYAAFMGWALLLFMLVFLGTYVAVLRTRSTRHTRGAFRLRPFRAVAFAAAALALAGGYAWVALSRNLLFRRIGWTSLAEAQLELSLPEFALYRTFIELGPFLAMFALVALRVSPRAAGTGRGALWVGLTAVFATYVVHVVANSRLYGALFLVALGGAVVLTTRGRPRPPSARRIAIAAALGLLAVYAMRVTENVRSRAAASGAAWALEDLVPWGAGDPLDEGYAWRLNGLDLMALVKDRVEVDGPAWGAAWEAPLVLALDPLVRTERTEQLKRDASTTAKSYLLARYAGIPLPDYYSCMLTDAYGNLGLAGLPVVGVVLGGLCALASAGVVGSRSPGGLLVSCFVLTRILPFEQEFSTLLLSWLKLAPAVLALAWMCPLSRLPARRRGASERLDSLPDRRGYSPASFHSIPAMAEPDDAPTTARERPWTDHVDTLVRWRRFIVRWTVWAWIALAAATLGIPRRHVAQATIALPNVAFAEARLADPSARDTPAPRLSKPGISIGAYKKIEAALADEAVLEKALRNVLSPSGIETLRRRLPEVVAPVTTGPRDELVRVDREDNVTAMRLTYVAGSAATALSVLDTLRELAREAVATRVAKDRVESEVLQSTATAAAARTRQLDMTSVRENIQKLARDLDRLPSGGPSGSREVVDLTGGGHRYLPPAVQRTGAQAWMADTSYEIRKAAWLFAVESLKVAFYRRLDQRLRTEASGSESFIANDVPTIIDRELKAFLGEREPAAEAEVLRAQVEAFRDVVEAHRAATVFVQRPSLRRSGRVGFLLGGMAAVLIVVLLAALVGDSWRRHHSKRDEVAETAPAQEAPASRP